MQARCNHPRFQSSTKEIQAPAVGAAIQAGQRSSPADSGTKPASHTRGSTTLHEALRGLGCGLQDVGIQSGIMISGFVRLGVSASGFESLGLCFRVFALVVFGFQDFKP